MNELVAVERATQWHRLKALVLDSVSSPITRRVYNLGLEALSRFSGYPPAPVWPPQETYSYYGRFNKIAFHVGYHNEHHDLPSVAWNHLPDIRRGAPEMYNSLAHHTSWTSLLLKFVFDPSLCLFSRTVRTDRGRVAPNAEVKPDIEFPDAC